MNHTNLRININPDPKLAPRYKADDKSLKVTQVVITEKGTQSDLPIVDFVCEDNEGNLCWFSLTGRLVNTLSAAIKGCNMRNHGIEEP